MGPLTSDPFLGERIESAAVLLGLDPDEGDGESVVVPPEPHPAASRANAITTDTTIRALRSLTVPLNVGLSRFESLPEPNGELRAVLGRRVDLEGPRSRSEVEIGDEMPGAEALHVQ